MNADDIANEYRHRSYQDLLRLALDSAQLTAEAQVAIAGEMARRGIGSKELETARLEQASPQVRNRGGRVAGLGRMAYLSSREEAKHIWQKFRSLRPAQRFGVVAASLVLIALPCWRIWQNARNSELELLYDSAFTGNLESVKRLSAYRFSDGGFWLERLARDRNAEAYARVAAIQNLAQMRSANSHALVPLLWIEVPFVVRDESFRFFLKRGCDRDCIRMSVDSLHALWAGHPTIEAQNEPLQRRDDPQITELRKTTEADYLTLLNSDPCTAISTAKADYSSETAFIAQLQSSLKQC